MPYYHPHDGNDFRRHLDSVDESSYDVFQSQNPDRHFQGQPYDSDRREANRQNDIPRNPYGQYDESLNKKSHGWIWILIALVALGVVVFALVKLLGPPIDSLLNPRPEKDVYTYNSKAIEPTCTNLEENDELNISPLPNPEETSNESTPVSDPVPTTPKSTVVANGMAFPTSRTGYPMPYYRSNMDAHRATAYDAIYNGIMNMVSTVKMPSNIKAEDAEYLLDSVRADHPEIFWVDDNYKYYSSDGKLLSLELTYSVSRNQRDEIAAKVDEVANGIVAEAAGLPNEYEKVKHYYTRLSDMLTYDDNRSNMATQTIEGPFLEYSTACAGYSRALQYLCYKSNIPCIYVLGNSIGDETVPEGPHAWNALNIDGVSVYADLTWGDTDQGPFTCSYAFLGLTSADLKALGHTWKYPDVAPVCDDSRLEEWVLEGTALNQYDLNATADVIIDKFGQGQSTVCLRFPDSASMWAFWNDYTSGDSLGAQVILEKAPWLAAETGYYSHSAYKIDELNVIAYSRA